MRSRTTVRFIVLGLLGILGVAFVWLIAVNLIANDRVQRKLSELRAAGQPLALSDLAREPIPPEANAATYLRRAKSDLEAIEKIVATVEESPAVQKLKEAADTPDEIDRSEPMLEAYHQAVEAHPNVWPLLEKAAACQGYDPQLDFTTDAKTFLDNMSPAVDEPRSATRALRYRALVLLADGKRKEAFDTCLTMLHLAERFDRTPTILGFLVAMAVRSDALETTGFVLCSGPLPSRAHDALESELARHDVLKAFQQALPTERALGLQMWDELPLPMGNIALFSARNDQLRYLELFDAAIERASRPYWDSQAQARVEAAYVGGGTLMNLLAPAIEMPTTAATEAQARLRSLRVLNAIIAREQAYQTDEPKLADLGLPAEVATDPFNGQPLRMKKTTGGWLIYSVGRNMKDDGGQIDNDRTDVGLAPPSALVGETKSGSRESPGKAFPGL